MFKRVEKRRRKQEEEEELGLDEDMKEVLGMNDTDSDESDSDSDESESEAEPGAVEGVDGEENEEDEEDSSEDGDAAEEPPISVKEALRDPVYIVSLQPDVKACIVCPGKVFKSDEILKSHRASKAHERRWRQFIAFAKSANPAPETNAWDLLKLKAEEEPKLSLIPSSVSKRSEKREKQKAKMEARREKKREAKKKAKTKVAASGKDGAETPAPLKKKRKVQDEEAPITNSEAAESPEQPTKSEKAAKARSPRTDRLERQGKLLAKLAPHEPPGGRGKGNGKKKGSAGRGKTGDQGKGSRKDGQTNNKSKPLQVFD